MRSVRSIAAWLVVAGIVSCASNKSTSGMPAATAPVAGGGTGVAANTPQPTPAASIPSSAPVTPATPPAAAQAGGPPGGPPGAGGPPGGGRARLTPEQRAARRDSATADRTAILADMSKRIAGYQNRRAEEEFSNVQLMKDTTAANLLKQMDYYGRSLGVSCSFCHVPGKWDEDAKDEKKTARVMINLVNLINTQGLSKLEPNRNGQTPRINCVTCHRGNTGPGTALLP